MDILDIAMAAKMVGGFEVVELTTTVANDTAFTEAETMALTSAWLSSKPVIIKCRLDLGTMVLEEFAGVAMRGRLLNGNENIPMFGLSFGSLVVQLADIGTALGSKPAWVTQIQTVKG